MSSHDREKVKLFLASSVPSCMTYAFAADHGDHVMQFGVKARLEVLPTATFAARVVRPAA